MVCVIQVKYHGVDATYLTIFLYDESACDDQQNAEFYGTNPPPTPTRPHDMTVQTPSVGIQTHSTPGRRRETQEQAGGSKKMRKLSLR